MNPPTHGAAQHPNPFLLWECDEDTGSHLLLWRRRVWPAGPAHQTRGVVRGTRGGGMVLNDLLQQHWHRGPENTDPFNSASQPWSLSVWFPRPSRSGRPRLASEPLLSKTAECSLGYLAQGLASSALGNEVTLGKFLNLFLPTSFSSLNRIPPS